MLLINDICSFISEINGYSLVCLIIQNAIPVTISVLLHYIKTPVGHEVSLLSIKIILDQQFVLPLKLEIQNQFKLIKR